jgi:outer membrane protein assembly factor BamB
MYCLNQTTGLVLWQFATAKGELGVRSSPAVHADLSTSFGSYDGFV